MIDPLLKLLIIAPLLLVAAWSDYKKYTVDKRLWWILGGQALLIGLVDLASMPTYTQYLIGVPGLGVLAITNQWTTLFMMLTTILLAGVLAWYMSTMKMGPADWKFVLCLALWYPASILFTLNSLLAGIILAVLMGLVWRIRYKQGLPLIVPLTLGYILVAVLQLTGVL